MVIESSSIEVNSNLDTPTPTSTIVQTDTIKQHQSNSIIKSDRLSWKFFDDKTLVEHLDTVHHDVNFIDGSNLEVFSSNDGETLLSNQDLLIISEDHFSYPPIIMSSSSPTTTIGNTTHHHHHHQQQEQINNNYNNINSSSSNNINSSTRLVGVCGDSSSNSVGNSRTRTLLIDNNRLGIENATTDAFENNNNNNKNSKQRNFNNNKSMTGVVSFHLGLCGWRKKCLYILILGLMLLIIVNLILTLWILKVMEFSSEGMGQLKIVAGGVQLSGQALIMDLLRASAIRSRHGQPISIESSRNFSIYTRDPSGELENHFFLGHDKLECLATEFHINDTHGGNLFSVNRNEVNIGAHTLKIDGEGGAIFRESIQTSHVRAEAGRELRLESPTRQLNIVSSKGITMQSRAGSIEMTALDDIKLSSADGSIRLDSSKIFLPNLRTAQLLSSSSSSSSSSGASLNSHDHSHRVYQLCACSNGKLFLAPPHSVCAGDDSTVCR